MSVPKVIQDIRTLNTNVSSLQSSTSSLSANVSSLQSSNSSLTSNVSSLQSSTSSLRSDVNSINKYNLLTGTRTAGTPTIVTISPIPKSGWTTGSTTATYTGGDYSITASSMSGNNYVHYILTDSTSETWLSSNGWGPTIAITMPPIKVTKVKLNVAISNTGPTIVKVEGRSSNAANWTELGSQTINGLSFNGTITLNNTTEYPQYRLSFTLEEVGTVRISKFDIDTYEVVNSSNMNYTVSNVPSTWSSDSILLVKTPDINTVGISTNRVNNILVDTILKANTRYRLLYRSNIFYATEV